MTIDETKAFDVFPEGFYKTSVLVFEQAVEPSFMLNIVSHVKSPLKESLG